MLYRIAKLNRWYDNLEQTRPVFRFFVFMAFVGLPFWALIEYVNPLFVLVAGPLAFMRCWWLSSGAAALRASTK